MLKWWLALFFKFSLNPQIDFCNLDHTLTKRGFRRVGKAQKHICVPAKLAASKGGGLGVFIAPMEKLAVAIPDTSGMTYTAPTVTELQWCCETSELPMNARTSERRNSRLTSELPTLSTFENYGN